mgnify:CR=1 FL=1
MEIDFTELSPDKIYRTVIQSLVPRPIAWVLTENNNQSFNLAPFSYFNAVSSDPPVLMFSVGKKPDGSFKDTRVNIEARPRFVIHIPTVDQIDAVNASSATLDNEASEVNEIGLTTVPFEGFTLPRIQGCPIAYACELFEIKAIGNTPMTMILGEIKSVYIDDDIIASAPDQKLLIDANKMNPLGRLGGLDFVSLGDIHSRERPV